ncbi:hypothetical protein SAMN05444354_101114 [Stigmatella aurantiaca]|uniref:Uncharacterized protein n=1 Tax=Stigmatella aurantiaca TaxID=41 RepID=A0A1H7FQK7_STIAU|nr:hypothetical protein [Stigmatella aurantiaca]SEK25635.1 hypothetical protein SAMN05444354_101114 [Stigmatella aurantiaca]
MSVRSAQAQAAIIARTTGTPARTPAAKEEVRKEPAKPGSGKGSTGGAAAGKSAGSSKGAGAQGLQNQDGMESGGAVGAQAGGGAGSLDKREAQGQGRGRFDMLQGESTNSKPVPQGPAREQPAPAAPELPRERKAAEDREHSNAARQALEGRAKLQAALAQRIQAGMQDVLGRLTKFIKSPGRLGVVNLTLVLSESAITYELWKEPSSVPARRERMALTLGFSPAADNATLLQELMNIVHQAFVDYQASRPGKETRAQYEEVLKAYDKANVLPIVPGHDTGPMLAELAGLKMTAPESFSRSLLVDPLLLAVGLNPDEGSDTQIMVAGLNVAQLGTLVAHMRRLNPRLTNKQVRQILLNASTDLKTMGRKLMGNMEVEQVQHMARQLLKLQAVEQLYV